MVFCAVRLQRTIPFASIGCLVDWFVITIIMCIARHLTQSPASIQLWPQTAFWGGDSALCSSLYYAIQTTRPGTHLLVFPLLLSHQICQLSLIIGYHSCCPMLHYSKWRQISWLNCIDNVWWWNLWWLKLNHRFKCFIDWHDCLDNTS